MYFLSLWICLFWTFLINGIIKEKRQGAGVKSGLKSCVSMGRLLNFSDVQVLHLQNGEKIKACCIKLPQALREIKYMGQCKCSCVRQLLLWFYDLSWQTLLLGMWACYLTQTARPRVRGIPSPRDIMHGSPWCLWVKTICLSECLGVS